MTILPFYTTLNMNKLENRTAAKEEASPNPVNGDKF